MKSINFQTQKAISRLANFMSVPQLSVMMDALSGEEGQYFLEKIQEYAELVETMAATYEQDGKGDEALVYLHYFNGGSDWYITERDSENEQHQAFGYVILNQDVQNAELGYISIRELTDNGVELDLHWHQQTLGQVKASLN